MRRIHPTAIVDPSAQIGEDVEIGPFAVIEAGAEIGDRVSVGASVVVAGCCGIGPDCVIEVGTVLGRAPQLRGMTGPGGRVRIGAGTIVREHVTIHRAVREDAWTTVGQRCFLLAHSHVAHDCTLGDDVTMANGALLAGYVTLGDRVFMSGNSAAHQFVRIGRLAMIGGGSRVAKDVLPFTMVANDSEVFGLNVVGMRRAGFSAAERLLVKRLFRTIYRSNLNMTHALAVLRTDVASPLAAELVAFIEGSKRGVCSGGPRGRRMKRLPTHQADRG